MSLSHRRPQPQPQVPQKPVICEGPREAHPSFHSTKRRLPGSRLCEDPEGVVALKLEKRALVKQAGKSRTASPGNRAQAPDPWRATRCHPEEAAGTLSYVCPFHPEDTHTVPGTRHAHIRRPQGAGLEPCGPCPPASAVQLSSTD